MNIMEENKESLQPQDDAAQEVTDNVTEETIETSEDTASPEGKQPAEKRWRFTTERVKVTLLAVIAACLVIIVFQNFFPTEREVRGYVGAHVDGGHVGVRGEVDVNLAAINGHAAFYNNPLKGDTNVYYCLPVVNFGR